MDSFRFNSHNPSSCLMRLKSQVPRNITSNYYCLLHTHYMSGTVSCVQYTCFAFFLYFVIFCGPETCCIFGQKFGLSADSLIDSSFFFLCLEPFLFLFLPLLFVFSSLFLPFLSPFLFLFLLVLVSPFLNAHHDQVLQFFFLIFPKETEFDFFFLELYKDTVKQGLPNVKHF